MNNDDTVSHISRATMVTEKPTTKRYSEHLKQQNRVRHMDSVAAEKIIKKTVHQCEKSMR